MPTRKRPYHHGDLRRTLLDASIALITERGLDALSLREIARRAGVSPAAPYHHFATREQLLVALAVEGFTLLTLAMQSARDAAAGAGALDRLRAIGEAYVCFAVAHPAHFRLMFRPSLVSPDALPEDGAPAQSFTILVEAVSEVLAGDTARTCVEPRELVLMAWCIVHGAAELLLDGPLAKGLTEMDVRASEIPGLVTRAFTGLLGARGPSSASRARPARSQADDTAGGAARRGKQIRPRGVPQ